jgi:hypothetical protein
MRVIASAMCAAADANTPLQILWRIDNNIFNALFEDCFDMSSLPSWMKVEEGFVERDTTWREAREDLSESAWEFYCAQMEERRPLRIKSHQIFYKGRTWDAWLSMLRLLKPHPSIAAIADSLLWPKRLVGVHIRRTDHVKAIQESPSSGFWAAMEAEPATTIFYVASDSEEERQAAAGRYPGRVITGAKYLGRSEPHECLEAMLDLYCLSRCSKIIGSYESSFSQVAAWWGGIPLEIVRNS